jgi:pimeloyl-ACP methyl ester carboxylesterase
MLNQDDLNRLVTSLSIELALGHFDLLPEQIRAQLPPPLPPERVVTLYGQDIHYYEAGTGPGVILLHGLGGEAANWTANIGPISQNHHVYALDQIGFGRSAKPLIEYRIQTFVDFLEAFMQELQIPKATLIGNSLGGWIAVAFGAQHAHLVDKLVLVDAGGLAPLGQRSRNLPPDLGRGSVSGTRKMFELIFHRKDLVTEEVVKRAFERHIRSGDGYTRQRTLTGIFLTNQFVDEKLREIRAPTLIIWGRSDRLTDLSLGERFQKGIPGAELVVLDECAHVPQVESPERFNKVVLDFLALPASA